MVRAGTHAWKTFSYEEVARSKQFAYLADPLMRRGYSLQTSAKHAWLSLFAIHNETVNVWSHLLGGLLFLMFFFSWFSWANNAEWGSASASSSFLSDLETQAEAFRSEAARVWASGALNAQTVVTHLVEALSKDWASVAGPVGALLATERDAIDAALRSVGTKLASIPHELSQESERAAHEIKTWIEAHAPSADAANAALTRVAVFELIEAVRTDAALAARLAEKLSTTAAGAVDREGRRVLHALRDWLRHEEDRTLASLRARIERMQAADVPVWPLLVFCFGGLCCLFCSAAYHWFAGFGKCTADVLCRVDLGGISFLIWGSFVPLVVYVFHDDDMTAYRWAYLLVGTALCTATLVFSALPWELLHRFRVARVLSYVGAGLFVAAPLAHAAVQWGPFSEQVRRFVDDGQLFCTGLLYLVGAFIYVARFPERFFPATFDFVLASHQIWHLLVLMAAYLHYRSVVTLYEWRLDSELARAWQGQHVNLTSSAVASPS